MSKIVKSILIGIFYLAYDAVVVFLSFSLVYQAMLNSSSTVDRYIVLLPIVSILLGLLTVVLFNKIGWLALSLYAKVCPAVCLMGLAVFFYGYSQYLLITIAFSILIGWSCYKIITKEIGYGRRKN